MITETEKNVQEKSIQSIQDRIKRERLLKPKHPFP